MASSKKNIAERMYNGFNPFFFRGTEYQNGAVGSANILDRFESVSRFYSSLESSETSYPMNVKDCFALKLACAIIDRVSSGEYVVDKDGSFSEDFYDSLACALPADDSAGDDELSVIYLKQMMNVMKCCGLVLVSKGRASVAENVSCDDRLYFKLLKSFWNETDWSVIFPSSPDAAKKLFEKRDIFIDFLEGFYTRVSVEDLANDFFEMTEIASRNDFFMISFLDFYLLTWLRHFAVIEYSVSGYSEAVHLMLSDYGREIIRILG